MDMLQLLQKEIEKRLRLEAERRILIQKIQELEQEQEQSRTNHPE